jgi:hypothetical protein
VLSRLLSDLDGTVAGSLGARLSEHLSRREVERTRERVARLLQVGRFPRPAVNGPRIPWPPF